MISLDTCNVHFKTGKVNYILLERETNDKTFRTCLFANHWQTLHPLIGCISYDLYEEQPATYKWYAYKPRSYVQDQKQTITVRNIQGQWYVILGFVDRKTDRSYSWWLTSGDWYKLINDTYTIKNHFDLTENEKLKVASKIRELSRENCHGCKIDHGSQKQHMEMGCMSPLSEIGPLYIQTALKDCGVNAPADAVLEKIKDY
jgi:hypothetical protein